MRLSALWVRTLVLAWGVAAPLGALAVEQHDAAAPVQHIRFDFAAAHHTSSAASAETAVPLQPTAFLRDLESLGLASRETPELARHVIDSITRRALDRVRQSYAPARLGRALEFARDYPGVVADRIQAGAEDVDVSRICVGGPDPSGRHLLGSVLIDPGNEERRDAACGGFPPTGVFPREFHVFEQDPLFRSLFHPFDPDHGGTPIGLHPDDAKSFESFESGVHFPSHDAALDPPFDDRAFQIKRAIRSYADALGSLLAHESGHALGLVPERREASDTSPTRAAGEAHNAPSSNSSTRTPHLMDSGETVTFADLVGAGAGGPLRFNPANLEALREILLEPAAPR